MPSTKKQMRAAGRELRLRRAGLVEKQPDRSRATRPFGACSDENLAKYAQSCDTEINKMKRMIKETGSMEVAKNLLRAERQKREGW